MKLFSKKSILWILLAIIYSLYSVLGVTPKEKCFKAIGCFNCSPPFYDAMYRPICNLPQDDLNVQYQLFIRPRQNESFHLKMTNESISASPFNGSLPTKVVIHGFNVTLDSNPEFYEVKDELLKQGDYNVILMEWTNKGNYTEAIGNGRAIAGFITLLLQNIKEIKGIEYSSVHIIGHSIGAHMAGWIGERLKKIGRITGLDPAGPYFQHAPNQIRLDQTDADFVDIIHTNGGNTLIDGFGLYQAIGHVDFYPNGGLFQPACGRSTLYNVIDTRVCDHSMSVKYFKTSINECEFRAAKCKNYGDFTSSRCNCNNSITNNMGFHARKIQTNENNTLNFYLHTTTTPPFCFNTPNCAVPKDENKTRGFTLIMFEAILSVVRDLSIFFFKLSNFIQSMMDYIY